MENNYKLHVGVMLKDSLETIGMSQSELCKKINVSPTIINEIIKGKRGMNAELAKKLEKVLDFPAKFWMNIQLDYELAEKEGKFLITSGTIFESPYSANEIADRIICYEQERVGKIKKIIEDIESNLTNSRMQLVLYFMQKSFIKKESSTLFNEKIEHWENGPVVPVVYNRFKKYGKEPIIEEKVKDIPLNGDMEKKVKALYSDLFKKETFYLIELINKEKGWLSTSENEEITPEMIKKGR